MQLFKICINSQGKGDVLNEVQDLVTAVPQLKSQRFCCEPGRQIKKHDLWHGYIHHGSKGLIKDDAHEGVMTVLWARAFLG